MVPVCVAVLLIVVCICFRRSSSKCRIPKIVSQKETIPFVPPITHGRVIKVYDGDTITIAAYLPYPDSPLYRFSVRLRYIDAPEIKGSSRNEKYVAEIARDKLKKKIINQVVRLKEVATDKYGRVLADVWYNGRSMSKWMLKQRLAVEYDGGKKVSPRNWLTYY